MVDQKKISPKTFVISSTLGECGILRNNKNYRLDDTEFFIERTIEKYEEENNCKEKERRIDTTYDSHTGVTVFTITCTFDSN